MLIYFGADHRGFQLKEYLKEVVKDEGYEIYDFGNSVHDENDDYPDFASAVARKVSMDPKGSRGILICGSGVGVDIVANKFPNVRAALALSPDHIYDVRHDDDVNILCIAADFISQFDAQKIADVFLQTPANREERYQRRTEKILAIETELLAQKEGGATEEE